MLSVVLCYVGNEITGNLAGSYYKLLVLKDLMGNTCLLFDLLYKTEQNLYCVLWILVFILKQCKLNGILWYSSKEYMGFAWRVSGNTFHLLKIISIYFDIVSLETLFTSLEKAHLSSQNPPTSRPCYGRPLCTRYTFSNRT